MSFKTLRVVWNAEQQEPGGCDGRVEVCGSAVCCVLCGWVRMASSDVSASAEETFTYYRRLDKGHGFKTARSSVKNFCSTVPS